MAKSIEVTISMKLRAKNLTSGKTIIAIAVVVGVLCTWYWYRTDPRRFATYKTNIPPSSNPIQSLSPSACLEKPPRGFTMSIEDLVIEQATDPSVVKIARAEYEIPRQFRPIPQRITGNEFILAGDNFRDLKVKNHPQYLRSLGVAPDHYIPIVEGPGAARYGFLLSYGDVHRLLIEDAGLEQETIFLSDPFAFRE